MFPNDDFEAYNNCPIAASSAFSPGDGIAYSPGYTFFPTVQGWVLPLENSSADYFNACASGRTINVSNTFMDYHQAHSGKGFVGMYTYIRPGTLAPPVPIITRST